MWRYIIVLLIALTMVVCCADFYLVAQERIDAKEEAGQHYLKGKQLYSEGQYKEATSEFEKAIEVINPPKIEFMQKIQQEQKEAIAPVLTEEPVLPQERLIEEETVEDEESLLEEEPTGQNEYYIDIGDVLDVSVWQVEDLSKPEVIVRPDGKISFPLVGDINAKGLTLTQLDQILTERLKRYLKMPEVSIMIRSFGEQANKVVVLGEIISPGIYKFSSAPTITEVMAAAGGYTKYAVLNSIMIIRGDVRTKPEARRVNFAQILKSAKISENIFLKPNDIVYVPRSFIGKVNTFLEVFQPAVAEYLQTLNARHLHHVVRSKGGI